MLTAIETESRGWREARIGMPFVPIPFGMNAPEARQMLNALGHRWFASNQPVEREGGEFVEFATELMRSVDRGELTRDEASTLVRYILASSVSWYITELLADQFTRGLGLTSHPTRGK